MSKVVLVYYVVITSYTTSSTYYSIAIAIITFALDYSESDFPWKHPRCNADWLLIGNDWQEKIDNDGNIAAVGW